MYIPSTPAQPYTSTVTARTPQTLHPHKDIDTKEKRTNTAPPAPPPRPPHLVLEVAGRARLDEPIRHLHVALRQRHVERSVAILRSPERAGRTATSAHAPREHARTYQCEYHTTIRISICVCISSVSVLVFLDHSH
jgi:hypothetical protein